VTGSMPFTVEHTESRIRLPLQSPSSILAGNGGSMRRKEVGEGDSEVVSGLVPVLQQLV
jgi:hypothetical protein